MSVIADELTKMADAYQQLGHPANLYRMVLNHGREYTGAPLPDGIDRAEPKRCFQNAINVADDQLTYTEGYLYRPDAPLLIHHAWCVTPAGTVVDPTIPDAEDCAYYGIEFPVGWVVGLGYLGVALERHAARLIEEGRL